MSDSSSNELVPYGDEPPKKRRKTYAKRSASLRKAMLAAVTEADVYEIVKLQVFLARRGDPIATREVLDRVIGKPASMESVMSREDWEAGKSSKLSSYGEPAGRDLTTCLEPADAESLAMDGTVPRLPPPVNKVEQNPDGDDEDEATRENVA